MSRRYIVLLACIRYNAHACTDFLCANLVFPNPNDGLRKFGRPDGRSLLRKTTNEIGWLTDEDRLYTAASRGCKNAHGDLRDNHHHLLAWNDMEC